jgi:prepilin-type N-terminal cleavage/methylation domain-containing protein
MACRIPIRATLSAAGPKPARRAGFTLAEVAVTIALVGLALVWMLQAINAAKLTAAYTRNWRLARELALLTLGQIEAGMYPDEVADARFEGNYADEGYPEMSFEVVVGEENFRPSEEDPAFDNWRYEQERKERLRDDEEPEAEQPYEKVQIKITFPRVQELENELVIERWLPWKQVHPDEEAEGGSP